MDLFQFIKQKRKINILNIELFWKKKFNFQSLKLIYYHLFLKNTQK